MLLRTLFQSVCIWLLLAGTRAAGSEPPKFALLIGVQKYAHLERGEQLDGCVNDVRAMRRLLEERFGFVPAQITTLVNEQATGAAIRSAFQKLLDRLPNPGKTPAQIVFHFSGHGSQVPDQSDGPLQDEPDGLDETLVPYDAKRQGGAEDLRDDELYSFVEQACAGGRAQMWLVLDCCHSGTGARGLTRIRKLHRRVKATRVSAQQQTRLVPHRLPAGAVALSACRAEEVEPEYRQGDASYGLLTRFVVQVLREERQVGQLSYDLLREAVLTRYRLDPAVTQAPVPQLEGDARLLRKPLLAATGRERPPYWEVIAQGRDRGLVLLKAGALHGVTVGSHYELYAQPEQIVFDRSQKPAARGGKPAGGKANGRSLGWLRIERVEGATARARAFRWEQDRAVDFRLPASFRRGFAVERFRQHGQAALRLGLVRMPQETRLLAKDSAAVPDFVRQVLQKVHSAAESPWLKLVTGSETCDVVLKMDGQHAALFPATGRSGLPAAARSRGDTPASLLGGWGPFRLDKPADPRAGVAALCSHLRRIARARNLLRVAAARRITPPSSQGRAPQVRIELMRVVSEEPLRMTPWKSRAAKQNSNRRAIAGPEHAQSHRMYDRELFAFRIKNLETAGKPVSIAVLMIDADMGISQVLPWQDGTELVGDNLLSPGAEVTTDLFECNGGAFVENPAEREPLTYGRRRAVLLATRVPNHFYMLKQESLPRVRGTAPRIGPSNVRGAPSPLESLLLEQTYFKTRGDRRRRPRKRFDESWMAAVVEWLVLPAGK